MNKFEKDLLNQENCNEFNLIAGCDEAGRGCLAGPLVVGGVILPIEYYNSKIKDSKLLSAKQREIIFAEIIEVAVDYAIVIMSVGEVERYNPKRASILGMERAINAMHTVPDVVLTDAEKISTKVKQINLIKGDLLSQTVGAASILAKVMRDRIMVALSEKYPVYDWAKNKGYGTQNHLKAIFKYGYCSEHRKTYEPIKSMISVKDLNLKG